jgi:hypothetical protein
MAIYIFPTFLGQSFMNKILFIAILLFFAVSCKRSSASATPEQEQQLLTYILQTTGGGPSVSACTDYVSVENLCIVNPDNSLFTCSESNVEKIKGNIMPEKVRTEEVLNAFFGCWKSCVLLYNSQDSVCSSGKYPSTLQYRNSLKSARTSASISWGTCQEKCNNGKSDDTILKRNEALYLGQPF